jgi:hypothetical protein
MVETFPPHSDQPIEPRALTNEETDLVLWLIAERGWQSEELGRIAARELRDRKKNEAEAAKRKTLDAHSALVESASGFRRAVLEKHGPYAPWAHDDLVLCFVCGDNQGSFDFPCDEYEFARDWRDDHSGSDCSDTCTLAVLKELAEFVCEQCPVGHCQDSDDRTTWCLSCRARGLVAGGK